MGLLYLVDVLKFARYCDGVADYERLTIEIRAEGNVIPSFNKVGQPYSQPKPKCFLRHQAFQRMQKLGVERGNSLAHLGKLLDDVEDDFDKLCNSKPEN